MDWKREIGIAHLVKQKVAQVDTACLWPHPLPEVAASDTDLISLEAHLGVSLDPKLRTFLLHADGWRSFYQSVDVFGLNDFRGGERKHRAEILLETLEDI
ncbi:SMI1/KNR4 family protein [Sphingomonas sp. HF-S3]|uniref:SMI1/KNR4 family protein n=1 Tax=Sphingomonas rustica TaxID=3103142 RepID=A0ABV0B840_9SPHN